jgi:SnoaL-like domain
MTGTTTLDARVQEMLDHHDIRKLLNTYCHGCDRGDGAMMHSVYADDSWDDHGRYKGKGKDFTETVMRSFADHGNKCVHLLGQSMINVTGDRAGAETYFLATILNKGARGEELITLLAGRYVDVLERSPDGWMIKDRLVVRDWSRLLAAEADPLAQDNFAEAKLSEEDPSYRALGLKHSGLHAWLEGRQKQGGGR